jgi:hypothetical protein
MNFPFAPEEFLPLEDWDERSTTKIYNEKQITLTLKRQGTLYGMSISVDNKKQIDAVQFNTEDDLYGFKWDAMIAIVNEYCK